MEFLDCSFAKCWEISGHFTNCQGILGSLLNVRGNGRAFHRQRILGLLLSVREFCQLSGNFGIVAPDCIFAPGCIFLKHSSHGIKYTTLQIYIRDAKIHSGANVAHEHGFSGSVRS